MGVLTACYLHRVFDHDPGFQARVMRGGEDEIQGHRQVLLGDGP